MILYLGGKTERREFVELAREIREIVHNAGATLMEHADFSTDETTSSADFFLLLRSFPDEFCVRDVERLRSRAPLAPIAIVSGVLCEGENRTGERFYGVRRFYAAEWRSVGSVELKRFLAPSGASGLFSESPLTSEVEYRTQCQRRTTLTQMEKTALILSDDVGVTQMLTAAFQDVGVKTYVQSLRNVESETPLGSTPGRVVVNPDGFIDDGTFEKIGYLRALYLETRLELLTFSPDTTPSSYLWKKVWTLSNPFDVDSLT